MYEIIVAENGSTDRTVEIAESFAADHEQIRFFSIGEPNYGKALREGIRIARGEFVICDEIDLCDVSFYRAIPHLRDGCDLVVGSKRAPGAQDRRPAYRRLATQVLNGMLRVSVGFKGTDTHGLKAFRRSSTRPLSMPASWTKTCLPANSLFERTGRATLGWKCPSTSWRNDRRLYTSSDASQMY